MAQGQDQTSRPVMTDVARRVGVSLKAVSRVVNGEPDVRPAFRDLDYETVWHVSLGIMRAFYEAGRRIPEDISIVGFDDVAEAEHLFIPLTTVRQDRPQQDIQPQGSR